MREVFYNGAHGNVSVHVANATVSLDANESVTLVEGMPIGTEIVGVRHVTDNLGAGTAAKVELVDADGNKTTLLTLDTSAEDVGTTPLKPIYVANQGRCNLLFTNTSGTASGDISIQLEYRFKGY